MSSNTGLHGRTVLRTRLNYLALEARSGAQRRAVRRVMRQCDQDASLEAGMAGLRLRVPSYLGETAAEAARDNHFLGACATDQWRCLAEHLNADDAWEAFPAAAADGGSLRCLRLCLRTFGAAACAEGLRELDALPTHRAHCAGAWLVPTDSALLPLECAALYLAACLGARTSPFSARHVRPRGTNVLSIWLQRALAHRAVRAMALVKSS